MRFALVLASLALTVSTSASAVITGLYNTGVDGAGVSTVGNGADLHWSLDGGSAFTGGVNGTFPIGPWLSEDATSRWITPTPIAGADLDPVLNGLYYYTLNFTTNAKGSMANARLAGRFAADNLITEIKLNGTTLAASGGGFSSWTSFASTPGSFVNGANTLEFTVTNIGQTTGNPSGLRVEFSEAAVPEPATWAMLIAGFGLVGAAARRRRTAVAAA